MRAKDLSLMAKATVCFSFLNFRQQWLLEHLADNGAMQKDTILAGYRKQFGFSKSALERDLKALRRRRLIQFAGTSGRGGGGLCEGGGGATSHLRSIREQQMPVVTSGDGHSR